MTDGGGGVSHPERFHEDDGPPPKEYKGDTVRVFGAFDQPHFFFQLGIRTLKPCS